MVVVEVKQKALKQLKALPRTGWSTRTPPVSERGPTALDARRADGPDLGIDLLPAHVDHGSPVRVRLRMPAALARRL